MHSTHSYLQPVYQWLSSCSESQLDADDYAPVAYPDLVERRKSAAYTSLASSVFVDFGTSDS